MTLTPSAQAMLLATGLALALLVAVAPARRRGRLLLGGLLGLAGLAVAAATPDPVAIAVVLALVGAGYAAQPAAEPFAARLRAPGFAAVLIGAGVVLSHAGDDILLGRLAGLAFVLGLVAAVGLVPFLPALEPKDPPPASAVAWTGFFGPAIALALTAQIQPHLPASGVPVYGSLLVGLGLLNLFWGGLGAWATRDDVAAWRYSFLADWGLALVGFGIVVPDGLGAAYLVLLSILLVRLPLYFWSRPVLEGRAQPRLGPSNLLAGCALAGAAPFAGFGPRVLLLRGATQVFWPLALLLGVAMLFWLAHSFRLARTLGEPRGRQAIAVVLALAASLLIGLLPGALLAMGRL